MIPAILANPSGTINAVHDDDPAAVKAAYRLFDSDRVTHAAVLAPHRQWVADAMDRPGIQLLIEDTTSVVPASQDALGLGPVDNQGRTSGFWLHSTLAVAITFPHAGSDENTVRVIGLLAQNAWAREKPERDKVPSRPPESHKWAECLRGLKPAAGARRIYVADRESDVWEVFERCVASGVGFVIRCAQDRALANDGGLVRAAVEAMEVRQTRSVELPRSHGQAARSARFELRFGQVMVRSPERPGRRAGVDRLAIHVVHVREVGCPPGTQAVEWLLLTTEAVETVADAWRVVAIYKRRWLIEEFHKGLKTGAGLEASQLGEVRKLMAWCGLLSVVTTWLLRQKLSCAFADQPPLEPGEADEELLALLECRRGRPAEGWTARTLTHAIARAGGFLGRKGDGNPGWQTLWRGWTRLQHQLIGFRLARQYARCGE